MKRSYSRSSPLHVHQQGAVLIALMVGILLITGAGFLSSQLAANRELETDSEVTLSLAMAKEALISYAVTYADNYGHNSRGGVGRLPCPAGQPHGSPALSCGRNAIGYLPAVWNRDGKRIDIDYREFFLNQNIWYAVSGDFRYNPAYNHLNPSAVDSLFNVNGRDEIVAVIIHPGAERAGQNRSVESADISDYLERENADGDGVFEISSSINDRVVTISRSELMPLIERRVLGVVRDWLAEYHDEFGYLPFAARLGDPDAECVEGLLAGIVAMNRGSCSAPSLGEFYSAIVPGERNITDTWFGRSGWSAFIYYQVEETCTSSRTDTDCLHAGADSILTIDGQPAIALLVSVGREITSAYHGVMQDRQVHPADRASYLDTAALVDADLNYTLSGLRTSRYANDQILVVR